MFEPIAFIIRPIVLLAVFCIGLRLLPCLEQRYPAHPKLMELDFEEVDPTFVDSLIAQTKELSEIGFDEPTLVQIPNFVPQVVLYLILLVNRQSGDKAMVTAIVSQRLVSPLQGLYLQFSTRFDSGEEFYTYNAPKIGAFLPHAKEVRTQVPSVEDAQELYRLHTFVMNKHQVQGKKVLYEPGQALDYLARFTFSFDEEVQRGWVFHDQESDTYRPTFKGACLFLWRLTEPFKALHQIALNRKAKNTLEEFRRASVSENQHEA
jgi:hypothetical protein